MNNHPKENYLILLVEDNEEDYYITKRAFEKAGVGNQLFRCANGLEALDYLYNRNQFADKKKYKLPNIILLDLNLPKLDGREVLQEIKKDVNLCSIPVIILTTSLDEKDIGFCYKVGANSYIQKPVDLNRFIEAIQRMKDYWFEIVVLPKIKTE